MLSHMTDKFSAQWNIFLRKRRNKKRHLPLRSISSWVYVDFQQIFLFNLSSIPHRVNLQVKLLKFTVPYVFLWQNLS